MIGLNYVYSHKRRSFYTQFLINGRKIHGYKVPRPANKNGSTVPMRDSDYYRPISMYIRILSSLVMTAQGLRDSSHTLYLATKSSLTVMMLTSSLKSQPRERWTAGAAVITGGQKVSARPQCSSLDYYMVQ